MRQFSLRGLLEVGLGAEELVAVQRADRRVQREAQHHREGQRPLRLHLRHRARTLRGMARVTSARREYLVCYVCIYGRYWY